MVLLSRLALASHYGTNIDFLNPAALRVCGSTDGLLTLITLRLASQIKNTKGRQPKRNAIPNRSPDLGIPSRTNALRPSFRPFCDTSYPAYRCSLHSRTEARAPVFVYGNLDLIPIDNRTSSSQLRTGNHCFETDST
ncbi:hypothetical protein PILCRDRAFT_219992 [Piloderma croceum F 1598]|uniref:Uncharacterized protein n=1 Tax=Piloderma croceum (strain F 1598) TaxID=765440 RepID=A0A0C3FYN7_PILCF|nr:hypothetical protein PILCRDRAFT_219992 [Piloderma croceum F 1598]